MCLIVSDQEPAKKRAATVLGWATRGASGVFLFQPSCVSRPRAFLVGLVVVVAGVLVNAGMASAATVADWEMNEPAGSTVMLDSSGSSLSGTIGSAVVTGQVVAGETAYRWTGSNKAGYHPERLVTVTSPTLNPGTDPFAITVRIYTGAGDQNILQKGQANTFGGMYKIDMVKGIVICMYTGADGRAAVRSNQTVWDHLWHTIRCERQANGVTLTIDGGPPKTTFGATGNIANNKVLSIGGKAYCDAVTVQCDYYVGLIDRAMVERVQGIDSTKPQVAFTSPADGTSVTRGKPLSLQATASDNVGVTKVEFRVNGSLKCTVTAAPYSCSWTPWTAVGTKNTLKATAYDAAGNSAATTIYVYTQ
jgi:Bacterial Ig domain/Laminin G domain